MYTFGADIDYVRYTWRCNQGDSWHNAETVEPADWRGGLRRSDLGQAPSCNPAKVSPVIPHGYFRRGDSESTTLDNAISVLGFSGSETTAVAKGVNYGWHNDVDQRRYLCGTKGFINSADTRIRSLP